MAMYGTAADCASFRTKTLYLDMMDVIVVVVVWSLLFSFCEVSAGGVRFGSLVVAG